MSVSVSAAGSLKWSAPQQTTLNARRRGEGDVASRSFSSTRRAALTPVQARSTLPAEPRLGLLVALTSAATQKLREGAQSLAEEAGKYVRPEALASRTPDLETIAYSVLRKGDGFELRAVESYVIAETRTSGRPWDFGAASNGFNTLAAYLFGRNAGREEMEMTTPVLQRRGGSMGESMDMTTPVISQRGKEGDDGRWQMAFVLPLKYSSESNPPPRPLPGQDVSIRTREENALRRAIALDPTLQVKPGAPAELLQYNPPFTPPFLRRNEIMLEVVEAV
eukprot:jgi/Chlat1/1063/Chrsp110S01565